MSPTRADSLRKMKEIQKLLAEVKGQIKSLRKQTQSNQPQQKSMLFESPEVIAEIVGETGIVKDEPAENIEETSVAKVQSEPSTFESDYEKLYEEFAAKRYNTIKEFIKNKTKVYLKSFCEANNLPIDAGRISKDKIFDQFVQLMAQRKAVTKKIT